MKKTKIIVPALGLLLLSTAASVTGTVAWFSANATVTASSMTVKANVGANLFIGKGQLALADLVATSIDDLGVTNTALHPATMSDSAGTVTVQFASAYSVAPTVSTAGTASAFEDVGTLTVSAATDATSPAHDLDEYCAYSFVTIGRKQSDATTYGLTTTCSITLGANSNLNKSLRAGVIINNAFYESADANTATGTATLTFDAISGLSDNTAYNACLVIWFEGSDSDCTTNNAVNLANNVASWTFVAA